MTGRRPRGEAGPGLRQVPGVRLGVRLPVDAPGIRYPAVERLARAAERGLLDFVLVDGDGDGGGDGVEGGAGGGGDGTGADPVTVLSALAAVTERIGLVAGVRGGRELARRVAELDRLSGGRAGWAGPAQGRFEASGAAGVGGWPVVVRRGEPGWESADLRLLGPVAVDGPPEEVTGRILGALEPGGGADGLLLAPRGVPDGLDAFDEFVDRVVPLLQRRGTFRTEYGGATLRSHLGRIAPVGKG
ncbi:LLM class flavin-dependent oxidoreductase [Streptomyces sp. NPDC059477]|uniref:LLM class flavin-dependent oxidoreductase n=1 Tax=Streptomyces sp. NPDC059477 TaxID=3346847 RepID=UPI003697F967